MAWAQIGAAAVSALGKGGAPSAPSSALGSSDGRTGGATYNFAPPTAGAGNITGQAISVDWLVLAGIGLAALWIMKKSK